MSKFESMQSPGEDLKALSIIQKILEKNGKVVETVKLSETYADEREKVLTVLKGQKKQKEYFAYPFDKIFVATEKPAAERAEMIQEFERDGEVYYVALEL
ncbi:MAG: hypothetical protein NUV82_02135 [Candidatus Komeilibacteria bacterium]|nr:hypothetical protein [Candidatus Komeilibacteria bacterium]